MERTLRARAASGMSWTLVSQVIKQGGSLVAGLILARLLGPEAYGLVGMVVVFTGFGALFVDLGLGAGLIQRRALDDAHIDAAFWISLLAGFAIAALMAASAPLIASFYNLPELSSIARVSSLALILGAMGTVQAALLSREMRFRALAMTDVVATIVSCPLAIGLAISGFGVWSLVVQTLSHAAIRSIALWLSSRWRPRFVFEMRAVKDLVGFSGNLFGFNLLNYWVRNADNLLVGRFLGDAALGLYARAYQLMLLPVQQLSAVAGNVMFPALASVQHDIERVRAIYLRSISVLHLLAAPIYAGLFAVADHFVLAVLGADWIEMTPLLRILCLVGFFQPVGNSTGWLYTALGRTDTMMKWGIFTGVLYVGGFAVGVRWGLLGVTWSYCIAGFVAWYPSWTAAGRLAKLTFLDMLKPLLSTSLCAISMAVSVWLLGRWLAESHGAVVALAVQVCAGAVVYVALLMAFRVRAVREAIEFVNRRKE
jgi:O-antigen/teichoic acid export membrane protein